LLFDDWTALNADAPSGTAPGIGHATRYQVRGGIAFAAWHSTGKLVLRDLVSDRDLGELRLGGFYNNWVWGIGVTDEVVHIIDDGRYGLFASRVQRPVRVHRFDRFTGAKLDHVKLMLDEDRPLAQASGLWCDG